MFSTSLQKSGCAAPGLEDTQAEAASPHTLPERLRELADTLAPLVVTNPNCPEDLFFRLADHHPLAALRNPVLPLILADRGPGAFSSHVLSVILAQWNTPRFWFDWAFDLLIREERSSLHNGLLRGFVCSPYTPPELLRALAREPWIGYFCPPSTSNSVFLEAVFSSPLVEARVRLIQCRWTPASLLERAALGPDAAMRKAAARNPSLPARALSALMQDPCPQVRRAIWNRHINSEPLLRAELVKLPVEQRSRRVKEWSRLRKKSLFKALAPENDRAIQAPYLEILRNETHPNVSLRCARSSKCPPPVLETLSCSTHKAVRIAVARHRATPDGTLEKLSRDRAREVREAAHREQWRRQVG